MDYVEELAQLAHLLKVGAQTAREIAGLGGEEYREVFLLAEQADEIAERLDAIAQKHLL